MLNTKGWVWNGGCAPSRAELKVIIIYGLKMSKTSNQTAFYINKGELSTCVLCVGMVGTLKGGGGQPVSKGGGWMHPPAPPPQMKPCFILIASNDAQLQALIIKIYSPASMPKRAA